MGKIQEQGAREIGTQRRAKEKRNIQKVFALHRIRAEEPGKTGIYL